MAICYLCGEEILTKKEKSIDHIPFSGLFLKPNPSGVIKLLTHKECHNVFSSGEEFFRNLLIMTTVYWLPNNFSEELWKQKVQKAIRHRKKEKLLIELSKEIGPIKERWPELSRVDSRLKNVPMIKISLKRIANPLKKIVRGLYFDKNKSRLENYFSNIKLIEGKQLDIPNLNYSIIGNGEFKYKISKIRKGLVFELVFYEMHYFRIEVN